MCQGTVSFSSSLSQAWTTEVCPTVAGARGQGSARQRGSVTSGIVCPGSCNCNVISQNGSNVVSLSYCSPPPPLSSLQSGYHECVEAMLTPYPGEVDLLVQLVSTEKIPETKALSLMEYLCNASTYLLTVLVRKLARNASTAGMELLR